MAERVERQLQIGAVAVMAALTAAAWMATYLQVRNMGLLMQRGVPMSLGMEGWADAASFTIFTGMWAVMMVAMMLPSMYPMLMLHRTIYRQRRSGSGGATVAFASAYFLTWTATGTLFFGLYVLIGVFRASFSGVDSIILRAAGAALLMAGVYQWTPFKLSCLRHCQSPVSFILHHWRDGKLGALRMGVAHGLYCFGCCWGLMLVLCVMGVMHLGWMAGIAALILVEKLFPAQRWISQTVGAAFAGLGLLVMLYPDVLLRLSNQIAIR